MPSLPETVLQFGAGNFLRAFADFFIDEMNGGDAPLGRIVVVQSTDSNRAAALSAGSYHVAVRGRQNGKTVDETRRITSVSRAISARTHWDEVLKFAESPELKLVLSNTTEAGLSLADDDQDPTLPVPNSFPAKLLRVLQRRFEKELPGLTVLPVELVEGNGDRLLQLCLDQAMRWALPVALSHYIKTECRFHNSLVDRIVPGRPADHPMLAQDPALTAAEPFAFWAIEADDASKIPLRHPAIHVVPDVKPYALRKIRILNGTHTAMVCKALPMGIKTVREAVEHPVVGPWIHGVMFEEIVPVLEGRVEDAKGFAEQTLERYGNPFIEHQLKDIALHHETKIEVRLKPTMAEYQAKFGKPPARLSEVIPR